MNSRVTFPLFPWSWPGASPNRLPALALCSLATTRCSRLRDGRGAPAEPFPTSGRGVAKGGDRLSRCGRGFGRGHGGARTGGAGSSRGPRRTARRIGADRKVHTVAFVPCPARRRGARCSPGRSPGRPSGTEPPGRPGRRPEPGRHPTCGQSPGAGRRGVRTSASPRRTRRCRTGRVPAPRPNVRHRRRGDPGCARPTAPGSARPAVPNGAIEYSAESTACGVERGRGPGPDGEFSTVRWCADGRSARQEGFGQRRPRARLARTRRTGTGPNPSAESADSFTAERAGPVLSPPDSNSLVSAAPLKKGFKRFLVDDSRTTDNEGQVNAGTRLGDIPTYSTSPERRSASGMPGGLVRSLFRACELSDLSGRKFSSLLWVRPARGRAVAGRFREDRVWRDREGGTGAPAVRGRGDGVDPFACRAVPPRPACCPSRRVGGAAPCRGGRSRTGTGTGGGRGPHEREFKPRTPDLPKCAVSWRKWSGTVMPR